jgi:FO synthase
VGDTVTFVHNRNINYTNVCTFKCRFCGFSKGPLSLNLRGRPTCSPSTTSPSGCERPPNWGPPRCACRGASTPTSTATTTSTWPAPCTDAAPDIHIHGFTALEVTEGARRLDEPLADYLTRLRDAGLRTLPGTAAEILDDEVRAVLCPDKITTDEWLFAHRVPPTRWGCAPT